MMQKQYIVFVSGVIFFSLKNHPNFWFISGYFWHPLSTDIQFVLSVHYAVIIHSIMWIL